MSFLLQGTAFKTTLEVQKFSEFGCLPDVEGFDGVDGKPLPTNDASVQSLPILGRGIATCVGLAWCRHCSRGSRTLECYPYPKHSFYAGACDIHFTPRAAYGHGCAYRRRIYDSRENDLSTALHCSAAQGHGVFKVPLTPGSRSVQRKQVEEVVDLEVSRKINHKARRAHNRNFHKEFEAQVRSIQENGSTPVICLRTNSDGVVCELKSKWHAAIKSFCHRYLRYSIREFDKQDKKFSEVHY